MPTIAIVQPKGGVGKTTLAVHLAAGLADAGKKTLLIDLDPQGSASEYLNVEPPEQAPHLSDVLRGGKKGRGLGDAAVDVEAVPGLSVVPGAPELSRLSRKRKQRNRLRHALQAADIPAVQPLEDRKRILDFDTLTSEQSADLSSVQPLEDRKRILDFETLPVHVVVIDTPPGWSNLTVNALVAARHVIAPVEPGHLSLVALATLVDMIEKVRDKHNPELELFAVVPSRVQATRLARESLEELQSRFEGKVLPAVRECAHVAEGPGCHLPVSRYAPDSIGAEDFNALTRAVLRKMS